MNNTFSFLPEEKNDSEIKNDNELRNKKKKLKKKLQKNLNNPSDDLSKEIKDLEIEIREYEGSQKTHIPKEKKKKVKEKEKNSDSDDFLDQEYEKNKDMNQKRYKEQKEREERERREQKEREKKEREERKERERERNKRERERNKRERKERENRYDGYDKRYSHGSRPSGEDINDILEAHDILRNDIPSDIYPLIQNYDHKLYRKLSVKYHPDKSEDDKYCKLLNCLKDIHNS